MARRRLWLIPLFLAGAIAFGGGLYMFRHPVSLGTNVAAPQPTARHDRQSAGASHAAASPAPGASPEATPWPSVAPLKEAELAKPEGRLSWAAFADHPVRPALTGARVLGGKEALLLYHGMQRRGFDSQEFASFLPATKRGEADWQRAKREAPTREALEAEYQSLRDASLAVTLRDIRVGPYDPQLGGLPVFRSLDPNDDEQGVPKEVQIWDLSASGKESLRALNEAAKPKGRQYTAALMTLSLDDVGRHGLKADFLPMTGAEATRVTPQLGTGGTSSGPGYRTVTGIFLVHPAHARARRMVLDDHIMLRKVLHLRVTGMVFAARDGTVLGVYGTP